MVNIPFQWQAYRTHQSNLDSRVAVDATSSGLEEGLNYLLEGDNQAASALEVGRVIASAARRDRYARSLLAKYIIIGAEVHNDDKQIEARSTLALLQRRMPADKLKLLMDLAEGTNPVGLVASHGVTAGALRTRISRARELARDIAG